MKRKKHGSRKEKVATVEESMKSESRVGIRAYQLFSPSICTSQGGILTAMNIHYKMFVSRLVVVSSIVKCVRLEKNAIGYNVVPMNLPLKLWFQSRFTLFLNRDIYFGIEWKKMFEKYTLG